MHGAQRAQLPFCPLTAHNPKLCVVMARATFRRRLPTRGIRTEIGSGHAGRCHVEHQAFSLANGIGCQEVLLRRECLGRIANCLRRSASDSRTNSSSPMTEMSEWIHIINSF